MQHPVGPDDELLRNRLVEAKPLADLRDLLGTGRVSRQHSGRITGGQPQHQENKDGNDHQHRDRRRQPAGKEGKHQFFFRFQ